MLSPPPGCRLTCGEAAASTTPFPPPPPLYFGLSAIDLWETVQLYHGKGRKVPVTESVWENASWAFFNATFGGTMSEAVFREAAAIEFKASVFEKDSFGALTHRHSKEELDHIADPANPQS